MVTNFVEELLFGIRKKKYSVLSGIHSKTIHFYVNKKFTFGLVYLIAYQLLVGYLKLKLDCNYSYCSMLPLDLENNEEYIYISI